MGPLSKKGFCGFAISNSILHFADFGVNHHILWWIETVDIAGILAQVLVFTDQISMHIANGIPVFFKTIYMGVCNYFWPWKRVGYVTICVNM